MTAIIKTGDAAIAGAIEQSLDAIKDPCMQAAGLDLSLVDLGLIRRIDITDNEVRVLAGLTEPGCGFTHVVAMGIRDAAGKHAGGRDVNLDFDWRDPWTEDFMNDRAKDAFKRNRSGLAKRLVGRGHGSSAAAAGSQRHA